MKLRKLSFVEGTVLVAVGLLLTVATVNDLTRQVHVNHRLVSDLDTWRSLTGLDYHNLSLEQSQKDARSTREVVCGNTTPGSPKARTRLCLVMTGPVVKDRRRIQGGYYLQPLVPDIHRYRYSCFGPAVRAGLCGSFVPPAGFHPLQLTEANQL